MSVSLLLYVCSKEEVGQEANDTISTPLLKKEGDLLNIHGNPLDEV